MLVKHMGTWIIARRSGDDDGAHMNGTSAYVSVRDSFNLFTRVIAALPVKGNIHRLPKTYSNST